ncbi:DUF3280 domain-containing protein [Sphaerotilus mobilis]|uniref:Uncharacterized protein DUF2380 n=1 Tax=Sphaerotilus mobilis TaxID=47994 RepID=A0A4Q7LDY5_9BURK|nr:DUF3280 domain-containing protein [Sphaerotilus mobilis]RZS52212.1 uncharacterized protein DUF2380 [Sphaerotilus mobilis]
MSDKRPLRLRLATLVLLAGLNAGVAAAEATAVVTPAAPATLAFIGFEVIDEQPDASRWPALRGRAERIGLQMAEGLQARGLYEVRDLAPAEDALQRTRDANEFLHRCNACLSEIGAAAGARLVGVGWVQRVSNLILNINLGIWDVSDPNADRMVLTKSVDIRGDNDESWRRGVGFMLRDMVERRERQPRYGL